LSIETERLRLRPWREEDRDVFAALNGDPDVARDLGGPLSRAASDAKLDRYVAAFKKLSFCRWAIETRTGDFVGYAGVMPVGKIHPLGEHHDIGWRLMRKAWGQGYATEAARAVLDDVFTRVGLSEVLSYTAADNMRSQAVMGRLKLVRDVSRDFTLHDERLGLWHGLVWVARPG
jgi:RimJ/RimL family protein N-acetyltransferase